VQLGGPEQVFRVHVDRPVANFGVAVLSGKVTPRIVVGGDENRLAGYTALALDFNPYRTSYGEATPVSGVDVPAPGDYDIVFDTPSGRAPGAFRFRFWIDDATPPSIRVVSRGRTALRVAVADSGSGIDARSLTVTVDGRRLARAKLAGGAVHVPLQALRRGRHTLRITVSDRQETKNMENVGPILPNTRTLTTSVVVR
jgi:hypothetical protein